MPGSGITIAYGDKGPLVLGVSLPQAIAAIILVSLRAYAARTHNGKTRWDFIFVTFGLIFGFAAQIALLIATLHGLGNQIADVSFDDLWNILYLTWIGLVIGVVGITFAKLAVVALWLHLTPPTQPKRRAVLWGLGALIVLTNTVQIPLTLTQCTPFLHLWDRLTPGSCPRQVLAVKFSYFQGAVAILSDIFLALYPINVVYNLKMSVRTKVVFCLLMAGGLIPAASAFVRVCNSQRLLTSTNITFDLYPFLLWATIEMWFVIILGSLPPLRPLFERVFKRKKQTPSDHEAGKSQPRRFPRTIGSWSRPRGTQRLESNITVTTLTAVESRSSEMEEEMCEIAASKAMQR